MAELEQLTLDSVVSPAVVLGGDPPDERGDLMPQHQELGVLGGRRPGEQDQPAAQLDEDEIEQAERHG